ncbi:MAG TPA: helix-hairpin-helix domain-containing protein [Blastocatellia bacterium]|nr:helix-hairpin-helix domain-containing protein [Blastocatellia bacterium]
MRLFLLAFIFIALGFSSCRPGDKIPAKNSTAPQANQFETTSARQAASSKVCLNLNTATAEELTQLPGVGEVIARRIIDYRERHARFRRPEEIIIVEGFSENKYRAISTLVCIE